jgi:GTP:adenosylcobinamide-phosphate guanylyltransferase
LTGFSALVLAGSRGGEDPVATYGGAVHKALIRLGGETLLARVTGALRAAGAGRVSVICNHPDVEAEARRLGLETLPAAAGPSASARLGAERLGAPLLITTADHALLDPAWIIRFVADVPPEADVAALVAARPVVEAAAPGTRRTWLKLADGHWSGCNLFWLANAKGLAVFDLWRRVEAERKRPWRMARILGPGVLLAYLFGRLTLAGTTRRIGALADVEARIVTTPFGLASVDVDKPADLDLVRRIVGEG